MGLEKGTKRRLVFGLFWLSSDLGYRDLTGG
jgi:hypothetical protein